MAENKMNILCIGVGVLISIIILITSINIYSFNNNYYDKEFEKNRIVEATGIEREELEKVTEKITGYLSGKYDELNLVVKIGDKSLVMFNQKEIDHMVDVKNIFSVLKVVRSISIILLLLFVILIRNNSNSKLYLAKAIAYNGLFTLLVFSALILMVNVDFTKYFVKFHEIFFTNDLWLLNPKTDRLIQMLPERFFSDIAVNISKLYAGVSLTISIGALIFIKKLK